MDGWNESRAAAFAEAAEVKRRAREALRVRALQLVAEGLTSETVSERLGVSLYAVTKWRGEARKVRT